MRYRRVFLTLGLCFVPACAWAAAPLPQDHEYQKQLRSFMATLTEKDFEVPPKRIELAPSNSADDLYRLWVLSLDPVRIGAKRSYPGVTLPANQFTLAYIEGDDKGVIRPAAWPEPLCWLADWEYPGNPYHGLKALKLRAFVTTAVDMIMLDQKQETSDAPMFHRADWFGPYLLMYGYTYAHVKDLLPDEARRAYEAGLKKMVMRVNEWGPKGEETHLDMTAVVGMRYISQSMDDPELDQVIEAYAKRFFTAGEFYRPAGYFTEQGCFDTGFNGLNLYFGTWIAADSDWPWAKEAVAKAWRLRGYLCLPEPSEPRLLLSPTHMSLRTDSYLAYDQWDWKFRSVAAGYLTDDALCQMPVPTPEELSTGASNAVTFLNFMLSENPGYIKSEDLRSSPWQWLFFAGHPNFPMTNYGHEYYPQGFAARVAQLQKSNSPLLKLPFDRPGTFVEQFDQDFLVAKTGSYGVVIHTGPVSEFPGKTYAEFTDAPYGLGGGCLSAFWTPKAGSAILGRSRGMWLPGGVPTIFDKPDDWRNWAVHAVIGSTADGKFFTSARIQRPESTYEVSGELATIKVGGVIPAAPVAKHEALKGKLDYARTFRVDPSGVHVETKVKGDGADQLAELYEVIPVFHREPGKQPDTVVAAIELESGGNWSPATTDYQEKVTAIRIKRMDGAVLVKFDQPRRVKLSPAETSPGFLSKGLSRNLLIDLMEGGASPAVLNGEKSVSYQISPSLN